MSNRAFRRPTWAGAVLAAALAGCASSGDGDGAASGPWRAYVDPAEAGFSAAALEEAHDFADENKSAAVVAVRQGRVFAAWGAVDRPLQIRSVRKSVANALYGMAVRDGLIAMDETVDDLGLEDAPPLTAQERTATFGDLITARSGVYHESAYAGSSMLANLPERDSHAPGTNWYYNNWDFNAAETAFEARAGEDYFEALRRRLADPLGMQDYDVGDQRRSYAPSRSHVPAHPIRMSARDLARVGQLFLQDGRWNGAQLLPAAWIAETFAPRTELDDGRGYGRLWWIYEPGALGADYPTLDQTAVYAGSGTGGQALFVIPEHDIVVAHLSDMDNDVPVDGAAIWALLEKLVAARTGEGVERPALGAVDVTPLASNRPAPHRPRLIALDDAQRAALAGTYAMPQGGDIVVSEFAGQVFMFVPGFGEAQLLTGDGVNFFIEEMVGVSVRFDRDGDRPASQVVATVGGRTIFGERS